MANYMDTTERTIRRYLKEVDEFELSNGKITKKEEIKG